MVYTHKIKSLNKLLRLFYNLQVATFKTQKILNLNYKNYLSNSY